MPIQTRTELIDALRTSGLLADEQLAKVLRELAPGGNDPRTLMRQLVDSGCLTVYQLRKVVHGKTSELYVGDYVITDKLGEGGMGKVYRARQVRMGREVALKIIRPNLLANPVIRGRYEREVKAASALRHPNIVAVEDAGDADGKTWLALEFVDGLDLARLVRNHGVLAVPEACEYIRQAALGLQHAHDLGFVHRDIKPSNIVVSGERHIPGSKGVACIKILDMGLVRGGLDDVDGGLDLTRAGTVVGTPDYMAPEQARNSSTVDHRADLYALGCSFYLLLTGKPAFPTGTAIDKLLKHQTEPPRPLQVERPDVPDQLAAIVARLVAKKPEQRYDSAAAVAEALAQLTRYSDPPSSKSPAPIPHHIEVATETQSASAPTIPSADPSLRDSGFSDASPFEFPIVSQGTSKQATDSVPKGTLARTPNRSKQVILIVALIVAGLSLVGVITWKLGQHSAPNRSPTEAGPKVVTPQVKPDKKP